MEGRLARGEVQFSGASTMWFSNRVQPSAKSRLVNISPGHSIGKSAVKIHTSGEVHTGP